MSELPSWAEDLDLTPHPEGGWYRETWRSDTTLPTSALPEGYPGPRAAGTAILFLLLPGQRSAWHTVRGAELWFHHRGGPLRLDLGGDGPAPTGRRADCSAPTSPRDNTRSWWCRPGTGSAPSRSATRRHWSVAWWCRGSISRISACTKADVTAATARTQHTGRDPSADPGRWPKVHPFG